MWRLRAGPSRRPKACLQSLAHCGFAIPPISEMEFVGVALDMLVTAAATFRYLSNGTSANDHAGALALAAARKWKVQNFAFMRASSPHRFECYRSMALPIPLHE